MAKMRPQLSDEQLAALKSPAEAAFYRACQSQLPDDVLVLYSAAWIADDGHGRPVDGESDFTLFFPSYGYLVIETKGGGIRFSPTDGRWFSTDRHGVEREIKDPFRQATKAKYAVLAQLRGHKTWTRWPGNRALAGHAVFMPDCDELSNLVSTNSPGEILGGRKDLSRLAGWLDKVNQFWAGTGSASYDSLGFGGVSLAESILCASLRVRPLLSAVIAQEEDRRIELTRQQASILRTIGGRKQAIISGGAGTGKTLIATEKARQLSDLGRSVLFLCYNRPLADHLGMVLKDHPRIRVHSFHQLCEHRAQTALQQSGRDLIAEAARSYPDEDRFDTQLPFALALSAEVLEEKFDAIIVDEAQDFSDAFWFPIESLLRLTSTGELFIFIDPNQSVYHRRATLPVKDEPYYLWVNCRNTSYIHQAAYRYYQGIPVDPPEIRGEPIEFVEVDKVEEQARGIADRIRRLTIDEGIQPHDVAILIARDQHTRVKNDFYVDLLAKSVGQRIRLAFQANLGVTGQVRVDTVNRFKGLESPIVILWLTGDTAEELEQENLYVGLSRAKSRLIVVGRRIPRSLAAPAGSTTGMSGH